MILANSNAMFTVGASCGKPTASGDVLCWQRWGKETL
jgi:hypothetical protein